METLEFEWDEKKRQSNFVKHGFDFRLVITIFDGTYVFIPGKTVGNESREMATSLWKGIWVTVVFTRRGQILRIISVRSARHDERRRYQALFSD